MFHELRRHDEIEAFILESLPDILSLADNIYAIALLDIYPYILSRLQRFNIFTQAAIYIVGPYLYDPFPRDFIAAKIIFSKLKTKYIAHLFSFHRRVLTLL